MGIDYDKTIENFFVDVSKYLNKRVAVARDMAEKERCEWSCKMWKTLAANHKKYVNLNEKYLRWVDYDAFVCGNDKSLYTCVVGVLQALAQYYDSRKKNKALAQRMFYKFLGSVHVWKYLSTKNVFAKMFYMLSPVSAVATYSCKKQR